MVARLDVTDLDASTKWYADKLGLMIDTRFSVPGWWAQLNIPGVTQCAIGLEQWSGPGQFPGNGGSTVTFVVTDIEQSQAELMAGGVEVEPIKTMPHDVQVAAFADPDGNRLMLRQNAPNQPMPASTGDMM